MLKDKIEPKEANDFVFAAAALLTEELKDQLYDMLQKARIAGDWRKVVEQTIHFMGEHLSLAEIRGRFQKRAEQPQIQARMVSAKEIAENPSLSLRAEDYLNK